jgi:predicted tellurium resistance membrane protein TerC
MEWITDPTIWASLLTLTLLEVVLGIDNVIFVSIVANRLPEAQRASARRIGLGAALVLRLVFLSMIAWIVGLTEPILEVFDHAVSWRDVILIAGGLFLIYKGTTEIHGAVEGEVEHDGGGATASFAAVIGQIIVLDLVFSIDSVVTAVGMAEHLWVMIVAVVLAMAVMLAAAGPISGFINAHPTAKMLALSFLLLIGMALIADGLQFHVPRGYLYAAVGFSVVVEALNMLAKRKKKIPV